MNELIKYNIFSEIFKFLKSILLEPMSKLVYQPAIVNY